MKRMLAASLLVSLLTTTLVAFLKAPLPKPTQKNGLRTIIVDAGHGGDATGAKGEFSYEKDICLDIALKLGKKLEGNFPELKVFYTRTTDATTPNRWRADFANKNNGDLYVSIHVNAMPPHKHSRFLGYRTVTYYSKKNGKKVKRTKKVPRYDIYYTPNTERYGTETYIWAADRADEKGEFVGEQVYDSTEYVPDINDPEFKAKSLLWTKKYFDKSLTLATLVEEEFAASGRLSTGVKQRTWEGIWVLQATAMPSILVETGFITNPEEEKFLNSESGQEQVADNVFNAIKRYKTALETTGNGKAQSALNSTNKTTIR
jgi:N-acetylmuramoyl-L-alanine amidase